MPCRPPALVEILTDVVSLFRGLMSRGSRRIYNARFTARSLQISFLTSWPGGATNLLNPGPAQATSLGPHTW